MGHGISRAPITLDSLLITAVILAVACVGYAIYEWMERRRSRAPIDGASDAAGADLAGGETTRWPL